MERTVLKIHWCDQGLVLYITKRDVLSMYRQLNSRALMRPITHLIEAVNKPAADINLHHHNVMPASMLC